MSGKTIVAIMIDWALVKGASKDSTVLVSHTSFTQRCNIEDMTDKKGGDP